MTKQVLFKPKYLLLGVENSEGSGAALPATSVLRTCNCEVNIGVNGVAETLRFDNASDAEDLATIELLSGQQNEVAFNTPFAFPDAVGLAGPLDDLLRICGFNPVYDPAKHKTSFDLADLDAIDSGHFAMRADRDAVAAHEVSYESRCARDF